MSPYEIGILLWYYSRVGDHESMLENPPAWRPTMQSFMKQGLIENTPADAGRDACYQLTEKGRVYVAEGLCKVPLPIREWRMPSQFAASPLSKEKP